MALKIALVGIYYPMAMLRYFERALERREDVELVTVGPYTGSYIPWNGGMSVLPKYDKSPTHPLPAQFISARKIDPTVLYHFDDLKDVDLWLEIDAGFYLDPKPKYGITAIVGTDPHVLDYDRQRQLCDYFFNMQLEYSKNGDIYLPYAYDPMVHYPMDVRIEYDVCMIGLHYDKRTELINRLIKHGLRVHYSIGEIFDEYRQIYNKSFIGINWSSLKDLNARAFELPAMGICAVQNTVPDMKTFFVPDEHYLEFSSVDEAFEKIIFALSDVNLMGTIASNGWRKVQPHTWDARVQQILERVGLA